MAEVEELKTPSQRGPSRQTERYDQAGPGQKSQKSEGNIDSILKAQPCNISYQSRARRLLTIGGRGLDASVE